MYNQVTLSATGLAISLWYPLAGFALIAAGFALMRIAKRKHQPAA
jgi:hypothetical protein